MFDDNDLPPARELPPGVRARARQRLGEGIAGRPARPARAGLAIAVAAAAVGVTAVGVPILTNGPGPEGIGASPIPSSPPIVEPDPDASTAPEPRFNLRDGATADDTKRCAADGWKPAFTASANGVTLITLSSGGKARFCELTPETVALSAPAAKTPTATRITYVSPTGTVAGTVADGEKYLSIKDPAMSRDFGEAAAEIRDGVFIAPNSVTASPKSLTLLSGWNLTPTKVTSLPALATPRKDRPQPDRAGLTDCAARPDGTPLIDAHAWQPGAPVALTATERVQTARYAGLLAFCLVNDEKKTARLDVTDGRTSAYPVGRVAEANPYVITYGAFYHFVPNEQGDLGSGTEFIAGLATDDRVARVVLTGGVQPIDATVTDGMFVLPGVSGPHRYALTVIAADGTTLTTVKIGG